MKVFECMSNKRLVTAIPVGVFIIYMVPALCILRHVEIKTSHVRRIWYDTVPVA